MISSKRALAGGRGSGVFWRRWCSSSAEGAEEAGAMAMVKKGLGLPMCVRLLKSCYKLGDAKRLHSRVSRSDPWARSRVFVSNLIIEMYGRCGAIAEARSVYDELGGTRNSHSLAMMLKTLVSGSDLDEAKALFDDEAELQDEVCSTTLVSAFANVGRVEDAKSLFDAIESPNVVSSTAMLSCYLHNGRIDEGRRWFQSMSSRNVVSWTAVVGALAHDGDVEEAREVYDRMPQWDAFSTSALVAAYADVGKVEKAKELYDSMEDRGHAAEAIMLKGYALNGQMQEAECFFRGMQRRDAVAWSALIHGYADRGEMDRAAAIFERMPTRDGVCWNTMLAGYATKGDWSEVKELLGRIPEWSASTWNALLGGYVGHGQLREAKLLFDSMARRNSVSWTTLLAGYAHKGQLQEAVELLRFMQLEGVQPNDVSYLCILLACSQTKNLVQARQSFVEMQADWSILPSEDHYGFLVNLSKDGKKAVETLPSAHNETTSSSLLEPLKDDESDKGLLAMKRLNIAKKSGDLQNPQLRDIEARLMRRRAKVELLASG